MRTAGPPPLAGVERAGTADRDAVAGAELPVRVVRMFAEIA